MTFLKKGVSLVTTVPTPWSRLAKSILLGFGIPFFLVGVVLYIVLDGNWALLLNGILWLLIGGGLQVKAVSDQRNLERLKKEGLCHDGFVEKIIPAHWIRIGSYVVARVESGYQTERGQYLVKSGYHLLSPFDRIENLHAKIYFDHDDPARYGVELLRGDSGVLLRP